MQQYLQITTQSLSLSLSLFRLDDVFLSLKWIKQQSSISNRESTLVSFLLVLYILQKNPNFINLITFITTVF